MTRKSKALLAVAATSIALSPVAAHADIVIDPANLIQAVLQVAQDVQLVEQFRQQLQNQEAMLKGWGSGLRMSCYAATCNCMSRLARNRAWYRMILTPTHRRTRPNVRTHAGRGPSPPP